MSFNNVKVISSAAVSAGATNDPVVVKLEDTLNQIIIYVVNEGDSTNLTVNVGSSPDGVNNAPLQPVTLSTALRVAQIPVDIVPAYLIFKATNHDTTNATKYSVIISQRA